MTVLKLVQFGNSVGAVIPKEVLADLHVEKGDSLFLTRSPDGVRITPYDAKFEMQITEARRIMKKRRAVLRELAK